MSECIEAVDGGNNSGRRMASRLGTNEALAPAENNIDGTSICVRRIHC